MINYMKLVHFEVKRFWKLYAGLALLIVLGQLAIVFFGAKQYKNMLKNTVVDTIDGRTGGEIPSLSITNIIDSPIFLLTIMLGAAVLIIYMFFIWCRDWFGKNTFAYRLLMLPTNRMNLFFAKGTAIFLFVFGLVAMQVILVIIEQGIINSIVPKDFIDDLGFINSLNQSMLGVLIPATITGFLINYGLGLVVLITVFTVVLLERSYRVRGIIMAVIYCIATGFIILLPLLIQDWSRNYFYSGELLLMEIIFCALLVLCGLLISRYLLNRKITV
ncbi:hypothetical protein QR721_02195 [Aciduricibacillus chroicocephali]|uniref:ABC transporter permease n=1 Tax=Aciduricibacillus chroicocephali TaxID=3054939 RepID=A0ABY9KZH7_9BACI|nr:hypothetical protein QR721_02195 [Bacillaceae bacterium 44XB]